MKASVAAGGEVDERLEPALVDRGRVHVVALADRISEPELRWWFERQPLAPN